MKKIILIALMSGMLFAGAYEDKLNAMGVDENSKIQAANKHRATLGDMKVEPKTTLTRTEAMNKVTVESELNRMGEADYMESASAKSAISAE